MDSPITYVLKQEEFKPLQTFLEQSSGQHIKVTSGLASHVITMRGVNCEVTIRRDHDTLAIVRIEMPLHHHGQGTWVLEWLKTYAVSEGLKHLTIEHTTSPEIIAFCRKHGFKPLLIGCISIDNGEVYGNYGMDLS